MLKTIFSGAFRPLFLLVGIAAPIAIAVWLLFYTGHWSAFAPGRDPLGWHMHEMLFGIIGAAVGGFLFTAVANWTGRAPLAGGMLGTLVALWLAGRAVMLPGLLLDPLAVAFADLAYLVLASFLLWRELYLGGNRRNYVILAVILLFLGCNLVFHLSALGVVPAGLWGIRGGVMVMVLLISVIGGRIIPAFTRNWLMLTRNPSPPPAEFSRLDAAAIGSTVLVIPCWTLIPASALTGVLMLAAALLHGVRLSRWRGIATRSEPLVFILHASYAWIPFGLAVLGASVLTGFPTSAGVHALTVGAMTSMIMAVSSRAALGHSGRPLKASRVLTAAYVLANLSALIRVAAALSSGTDVLTVSGLLWIAAFVCFVFAMAPVLTRPRLASPL